MADSPAVIYEDDWLLAVDKPAGLLVHGDGTGAPTLTGLVRAQLEGRGEHEAARQLQAVQRLDVDTTGIVLFSKDKTLQPRLDALVAGHVPADMRKRYLVVVRGDFPWEVRELTAAVARDRHDARRMRAVPVGRGGKPALTRVRRLAVVGTRGERLSLLLAELGTGRKHQIRVHLSSAGFPVLGDRLYGVPQDRPGTRPLMLHAWAEDLAHPVTGRRLALRTPVPVRFTERFSDIESLISGM